MIKETDIAYLAGLLDGEAYIGIKKSTVRKDCATPGYHARIQVRMVDEAAIRFLADTMGGNYYREKPNCKNGRPLYCYQASDLLAEKAILAVLPYLRVKRASAEKTLELRALQSTRFQHKTKVIGEKNFPNKYGTVRMVPVTCLSDEYIARCDALRLRCKELNRAGV